MKSLFGSILAIFLLPVMLWGGEKKLAVADTLPETLPALKSAAILLASTKDVEISFEKTSLDEALAGVKNGRYDLAVAMESASAETQKDFEHDIFAFDAIAFYVNSMNLINDTDSANLKKVWDSYRPMWLALGGGRREIHRMGINPGRPGAALIESWLGKYSTQSGAVFYLNSTAEMLLMIGSDTEALGLGRFIAEYPATTVKALAVDGVNPALESIRNGKYPLSWRYLILSVKKSELASEFIALLSRPEIAKKLEANGLLLP